jgi:hypothetical protein
MKRNWHQDAACNGHPDPDLWHYENSVYVDEQKLEALRSVQAIEICNVCPVKAECLKQGLEQQNILSIGGSGSVWGGLLTGERALMAGLSYSHNSVRHERRHRATVRRLTGKIKV